MHVGLVGTLSTVSSYIEGQYLIPFSRFLTGNVRIVYAWMLSGFITHIVLVYACSSLETVWYLTCVA